MVLPLYLAAAGEEMTNARLVLGNWPDELPPAALLVLTDRLPFGGDPVRIAGAVKELNCSGVLLDFEREPDADSKMVADALFEALPCPVAAPPGFVEDSPHAVFLPSCPLHVPLAEFLRPWQSRDIWLEAALWQQTVTVTAGGTRYGPATPADRQGGVLDETLRCRCLTEIGEEEVRFTLFDTPDTLRSKLELAASLGVSRAVGLYQELGGISW